MPSRIPQWRPPRLDTPKQAKADTAKHYDRYRRDQASYAFYHSEAWRRCRLAYLSEHPLCEDCLRLGLTTEATQVHHKQELKDRPDLALDHDNLAALCPACHNRQRKKRY